MKVFIPIKLPSLANLSMHWRRFAAIKKQQRNATRICFHQHRTEIPPPPLLVVITRVGPRKLDGDNLQSACKYVRDQIAAEIGIDDGSDIYIWDYRQRVGKPGVEVEITSR